MQNLPTIILLALLIVCIGFFTSSETAFLSLSKLKIRTMVQNRKRNAKLIFNLKNKKERGYYDLRRKSFRRIKTKKSR